MSLVFPKILTMEEFGYWQYFLFYSSFVGFFHFGLNDGIYLRYGGKKIISINRELIKSQFLILFSLQIVLGFVLFVFQYFYGRAGFTSIAFAVIVFMIINNLSSFMMSLFQSLNKLKLFSNVTLFSSFSFLLMVAILFLTDLFSFYYLIQSYILSFFLGLLYVFYVEREIFLTKIQKKNFRFFFSEYKKNTIVGFFLMISTISSMLILGVGRFAIERKWGIVTFGIVSLSFTVTTFILFFVRQIGIVIFPLLKNLNKDIQKKYFDVSNHFLNFFLLACLFTVPIISSIILHVLPNYSKSLVYFIYIVPMIVYEGKMQIVLNTYMKALRKEKALMYINILSLLVSILFSLLGYWFGSLDFIILSITFATIFRGVLIEMFLKKQLNVSNYSWVLVLIMLMFFVILFSNFKMSIAFFSYLFLYFMFLLFYKNKIKEMVIVLKKHL